MFTDSCPAPDEPHEKRRPSFSYPKEKYSEKKNAIEHLESDRRTFKDLKRLFRLRLTLLEVYKSMNDNDMFFFHHQMKNGHILPLSDEVVPPLSLFNELIKKQLVTPRNVKVISEAFFRMKRHGLTKILNGEIEIEKKPENVFGRDRKTTVPNIRHQQPSKRSSSDQTLISSKVEHQSNTNNNVNVGRQSSNIIQRSDMDQQLTDQFILRFCSEELGPNELMHLGVKGFKLSIAAVQRAQYDSKSTLDACIAVFMQWRNSAPLPASTSWFRDGTMPSYTMRGLGKALRDCTLNNSYRKYFM